MSHPTQRSLSEVSALTGRIFGGRYRVEELVGKGGMSMVYRAVHLQTNHVVALKVMTAALGEDEKQILRFEQEARASSRLRHPSIIKVLDYGRSEDGLLFIAMELLSGRTLGQRLKADGPLPVGEACRIMHQTCEALSTAHQLGIIHRDLKPDNIFLPRGPDGELLPHVKLLDFGIAKVAGETGYETLTQTGFICGTPLYISPEQSLGMDLDGRSDLYSVGVLLFELLTGKTPFLADTPIALVMKHIHNEPPTVEDINPQATVPDELKALIYALLAKDRERRPRSAGDVSAALAEMARAFAHIPGAPVPGDRPVRKVALPQATPAGLAHGDVQLGTGLSDRTMVELPMFAKGPVDTPEIESTRAMARGDIERMRALSGASVESEALGSTRAMARDDLERMRALTVGEAAQPSTDEAAPKNRAPVLWIVATLVLMAATAGVVGWFAGWFEPESPKVGPKTVATVPPAPAAETVPEEEAPTETATSDADAPMPSAAPEEVVPLPRLESRAVVVAADGRPRRGAEARATPAAPPNPAVPTKRVVRIDSVPTAAMVVLRGEVVGKTPFSFEITDATPETTVIVSKDDHLPQTWRYDPKAGLAAGQDQVKLVLERKKPVKRQRLRNNRKKIKWEE